MRQEAYRASECEEQGQERLYRRWGFPLKGRGSLLGIWRRSTFSGGAFFEAEGSAAVRKMKTELAQAFHSQRCDDLREPE